MARPFRGLVWWSAGGVALVVLLVVGVIFLSGRSGDPVATPPGGCLTTDEFGAIATTMAPGIFEGSAMTVRAGAVTCASGWAKADVAYVYDNGAERTGWVVLHYVDDEWRWAVDDYWHQFGDLDEMCARLPDQMRAGVGCASLTPSPTVRPDPGEGCTGQNARNAAELAAASWDGLCIPGDFCAVDGLVRLSKGSVIAESADYPEAHIDVIDDKNRGDINGDGHDDIAVEIDCTTGGGMAASRMAQAYAVVAGGPRPLTLLGMITAQKQEEGVAPTLFDSITFSAGAITVKEVWYRDSDATCCPSGTATTVWTLDPKGSLIAGAPDVTG